MHGECGEALAAEERNGVKTPTISELHAEVERSAKRLHVLHEARTQCKRGCSSCCVDDLTVYEVEADEIRAHYAKLLAQGAPHEAGACAFLDEQNSCRIYAHRPYVCRTQGLPLRWIDEQDDELVELRDICPLNEEGPPLEELDEEQCWTLGPTEEALVTLQVAKGGAPTRVRLRELFLSTTDLKAE